MKTISKQKGFTLIELLVVISIIGLLSSVVLASLSTARDKGRIAAGQKFYSHNSHALAIDAVAYWSFDEGAGSTVADSWGSNNNGTVTNPVWQNGMYGKSLTFVSPVSTYVDVPSSTSFNATDELTIMAWIYTTTTGNVSQQIITRNSHFLVSADKFVKTINGKICFVASGVGMEACSLASLSPNKWHYIAVTAKEGLVPNFYVDGQLRNDPANAVVYNKAGKSNAGSVVIGAALNAALAKVDPFQGSIDELGVYSKSFSLAQIQEYYAMTASKYGIAMNR